MDAAKLTVNEKIAIEKWAKNALVEQISIYKPATIHLDELFTGSNSSGWVQLGLGSFSILSTIIKKNHDLLAVLCFPLGCSEDLNTSIPDWTKIGYHHGSEPPSLYVLNKESLLLPNLAEEYRCPILPPKGMEQVMAYYRCFRTNEAIKNGWEYERAIYIECRASAE